MEKKQYVAVGSMSISFNIYNFSFLINVFTRGFYFVN